jgi:hypothetical protein
MEGGSEPETGRGAVDGCEWDAGREDEKGDGKRRGDGGEGLKDEVPLPPRSGPSAVVPL